MLSNVLAGFVSSILLLVQFFGPAKDFYPKALLSEEVVWTAVGQMLGTSVAVIGSFLFLRCGPISSSCCCCCVCVYGVRVTVGVCVVARYLSNC
jgi:hypothetical protein